MSGENERRTKELLAKSKRYQGLHQSGALRRQPVGVGNVLRYKQRAGFHRVMVEDVDGQLDEYFEAGYTIAQDESSLNKPSAGSSVAPGTAINKMTGGGNFSYLMEIPIAAYEEAETLKVHKREQIRKTLHRRPAQGVVPDKGSITSELMTITESG